MIKPRFLFDGMSHVTLRLLEADVDQILDPDMAYEAVRDALVCHAEGRFVQPEKPYVRPRGRTDEYNGGRFIAMPAYVGDPVNAAGLKWIAGFQKNVERGKPRASAVLILNSIEDGSVMAIMDCAVLSARRTAAVAAISVDHLAVEGPKEAAILGAGPICQAVIESLSYQERGITRFRVFDPATERVKQLLRVLNDGTRPIIESASSAQECVHAAEVVVTATSGAKGYLEKDWITEGCLIVALSLDDPTPELFLSADKVIMDDIGQCLREEKLVHQLVQQRRFSREDVYAELGDIVTGRKPGRADKSELILVNPMGMAVEDISIGLATYKAAIAAGIGEIESTSGR